MRYRALISLCVCLLTGTLLRAVDDASGGIILLPMDAFVAVPLPPTKDVVLDSAFHMYRVGRDNRSARALKGPQRVVRTVRVPAGGGRFETSIAPLGDDAVVRVSIAGAAAASVVNAPRGKWSPVTIQLPADKDTVDIEEVLETSAGTPVLWGDDRVSPALPASGRPDVVVITLDTTRPDYLTPYAPNENTTPTLAALAHEGTRFDQAISVSSWTMPAHAALFTGEFPSLELGFGERVEPAKLTMAEIFAGAGYNTHGASGGPYTDAAFGFQQGYRTYLDSAEWKNAESVTSWALERVTKSQRGAPLFLFLNYFDAHEPYPGVTAADWQALDSGKAPLTPAKIAQIREGYRDGLRAIDRQLARLFDGFRRSRDWQNTVVIVVGDHGQLLGERGFLGHALSLDEELIHVPLVVRPAASRRLGRAVYSEQFQITDVLPLTLELAGLEPAGEGSISRLVSAGRPVRSLTFAELRHAPSPALTAMPRWSSPILRAIRTDSMKVVQDQEGRATVYALAQGRERVVPPGTLSRRLLGELAMFVDRRQSPLHEGSLNLPADLVERLRALGYIR
jgi:arylsulfatase A-like enzyme